MRELKQLFDNNQRWAASVSEEDPEFFRKLSAQQTPPYLWIGCADSRVPANQIVGLPPGEIFVHRNIANVVSHTDFNCLSVIQYAVEVLKVRHIIVCGHYGCGGVAAALSDQSLGLIDNWLRHIKDVCDAHGTKPSVNEMCELNVAAQVRNVCYTSFVQNAWRKGQELSVHGWIYSLEDGLLKDLGLCISDQNQLSEIYRLSLQRSEASGP